MLYLCSLVSRLQNNKINVAFFQTLYMKSWSKLRSRVSHIIAPRMQQGYFILAVIMEQGYDKDNTAGLIF